jgi:hypothetical protein
MSRPLSGLLICVLTALNAQGVLADAPGTAFCARLVAKYPNPTANKIYFEGADGPKQLIDNEQLDRGQTNLFYYRKRTESGDEGTGAFVVKLRYARSIAKDEDRVILFNSKKTVQNRCKVSPIGRYEGFHGAGEEPNTCIKYSFHQGYRRGDPKFNTLEPPNRRREFVFGLPGQGAPGISFVLLDLAKNIFVYPEKVFPGDKASQVQSSKTYYRSQIYNYSGEAPTGSCLRFVLLSGRDDLAADIDLSDLVESVQDEPVRVGVRNITFSGN